jgi:hypothetical protein
MTKERMKPAPPTVAVYWQATVTKTDSGKLVRKTRRYRARSFVGQFIQVVNRNIFGQAQSATGIDSVSYSLSATSPNIDAVVSGFGIEAKGIVAGLGNTAVAATDTYLATPIVSGTGTNQLVYNATTGEGAVGVGASLTSQDLTRSLGNSSGAAVLVEEIGLVVSQQIAATQRGFLILRDLTGTITVGDGESLTITYTIQTSI